MTTFSSIEQHLGQVPGELTLMLREIDQAQGRQDAFRLQHPQRLDVLTRVARIESTEASNEIEGIRAPHARIAALVADTTTPRNRSEAEIAGYRKVLDLIHSTAPDSIPFTVSVVKQFHGMLYEFAASRGGAFKQSDNEVVEELLDGTRALRFTPVPAWRTEDEMRLLHEGFAAAMESGRYHPVLLAGAYVLDFLVIHPFSDGNGRVARLLTLLLLYKSGYEVGRYISLEKLVAETKETYYEALGTSTLAWHEDEHDPVPWLRYILGVMIAAYRRFEERGAALAGRGSKGEAVRHFVRSSLSDEFTIADIRRAAPGVSDDHIRKVLASLRADGVIEGASKGRAARYRRLRATF